MDDHAIVAQMQALLADIEKKQAQLKELGNSTSFTSRMSDVDAKTEMREDYEERYPGFKDHSDRHDENEERDRIESGFAAFVKAAPENIRPYLTL